MLSQKRILIYCQYCVDIVIYFLIDTPYIGLPHAIQISPIKPRWLTAESMVIPIAQRDRFFSDSSIVSQKRPLPLSAPEEEASNPGTMLALVRCRG